jgi:UDP-2,3-diacylglucosamine pyrophosphatase LpxH
MPRQSRGRLLTGAQISTRKTMTMCRQAGPLRAIFISDLHIGTPGFQAEALLDFLKHHPSDVLYLVGDIVDGWQLRRRWFWPQSHNDVVQKLLRRARKGCRVIYVPGNHDEFARHFVGHAFGGVEVLHDTTHTTATGLKLWVVHGDHFDGVIQCAKWLAYVGDGCTSSPCESTGTSTAFRARMGWSTGLCRLTSNSRSKKR